jgi:MFS family permease
VSKVLIRGSRERSSPLVGLLLATLLASIGTSAANVALPTLAAQFATSVAQTQWVVIGYLISMTVAALAVGLAADTLGRKRVLVGGLIIFTLATIGCAFAPELWILVAARAIQGVGAATMVVLPLALVRDLLSDRRTGSGMGWLSSASAVGTALGPASGGLLIQTLGWPAIFLTMVPIGLVAVLLTTRAIPVLAGGDGNRGLAFDPLGTIVFTLALLVVVWAVTNPLQASGWMIAGLLGGAATLLLLFVAIRRRTRRPSPVLLLLRRPELNVGLVRNLIVGTVMMSTLVVGPFYLTAGLGLTPWGVGLTLTLGPAISVLAGGLAGRVVDRFGARSMTRAGLLGMTIGAVLLAALPPLWGIAGYVMAVAVLTPAYQLFLAANNTHIVSGAPANQRGTVAGLLSLSRNLGLIAGASVIGTLFATTGELVGGSVQQAATAGLMVTFVVGAVLLLVGVAYGALPRIRPVVSNRHNPGKETAMIVATLNGTVLAEAEEAEVLHLDGTVFFPPSGVKRTHLEKSPSQYTCSVKGEVQYFSVKDPQSGAVLTDLAWSYPSPTPTSIEDIGVDFSDFVGFGEAVHIG